MATTIEEKIKRLEEQLKQEKAKKKAQEARKREAENKAKRALETRKKILLGAVLMERLKHDPQLKNYCMNALDKALTRAEDRALFGLAQITAPGAQTKAAEGGRSGA